MNHQLFEGRLVRLTAEDPDLWAEAFSRWAQNGDYIRLLDSDAPRLWSRALAKEWMEKELLQEPGEGFLFAIRTLEDDRLIGFIDLDGIEWAHGDAWVGIGIGEPDCWGRGYGTDAMRVLLRFAFEELNLHRVTLNVFEYNLRAIRAYQKAGFQIEGRQRAAIWRDGRAWDVIYMGVLASEVIT